MRLVMTLVTARAADVVDAQIAYHLNAGVDFVLATDHDSRDGTAEILASYERAGHLRLFREEGELRESEWRTRMARLAATEHGADWVITSRAHEFWWPRAENLKDVLVAMPPRYTTVQALVRHFLPHPGDEFFSERMTVRQVSQAPAGDRRERLARSLRPVHRADPAIVFRPNGAVETARAVPLRAWYPIEVLSFPVRGAAGENAVDEAALAEGLEDGSLAIDTRLRDALRTLRISDERDAAPGRSFALPEEGASRLALRAPDVVDDAAYAIECAEVGEVDLASIERHVDELERRIAWLEERFWPRVLRRVVRLTRRGPSESSR
jgi:hypothetical protein